MNINMEQLRDELGKAVNNSVLNKVMLIMNKPEINKESCGNCAVYAKPVNIDISVCGKCTHNYKSQFRQKELEWYEIDSNFPVLCKVWDMDEVDTYDIVSSYELLGKGEASAHRVFHTSSGTDWRFATPVTATELTKFILEYK